MTAPVVQNGDPIILGNYVISGGQFGIVGYASPDDASLSPTADVEKKKVGGVTVQEIAKNPGLQFSGTLVVESAASYDWEALPKGDLIDITIPGHVNPTKFVVDDSKKSSDPDTGELMVALTAHHDYSMADAYEVGPIDPATGEPAAGLVKVTYLLIDDTGTTDGPVPATDAYRVTATETWTDTNSVTHTRNTVQTQDGILVIFAHSGASVSFVSVDPSLSPFGDGNPFTVPATDSTIYVSIG